MNNLETKFRYINAGYQLGLSSDKPLQAIIIKKMEELAKGKYGEKWKCKLKGYSLGIRDRQVLARQLELKKTVKSKAKDRER